MRACFVLDKRLLEFQMQKRALVLFPWFRSIFACFRRFGFVLLFLGLGSFSPVSVPAYKSHVAQAHAGRGCAADGVRAGWSVLGHNRDFARRGI
jgi:hypothetical protein